MSWYSGTMRPECGKTPICRETSRYLVYHPPCADWCILCDVAINVIQMYQRFIGPVDLHSDNPVFSSDRLDLGHPTGFAIGQSGFNRLLLISFAHQIIHVASSGS